MKEYFLGKKRVRLGLLAILMAGVIVFGVGVHFVHAFQVKRNASDIYAQALQMEKEGRIDLGVKLMEQYVHLAPKDTEGLAKFGIWLAQDAKSSRANVRAMQAMEQVLRQDPSYEDVRRRLVKLLVQRTGRYIDARVHLAVLLEAHPQDVEVWYWSAKCETGAKSYDKAAEWYAKALKESPVRVDIAIDYAVLLHDGLHDTERAEEVIERLVKADPKSVDARLKAAAYYFRVGPLSQAERHLLYAQREPTGSTEEVLLLAADVALAQGKIEEARAVLQRGRKQYSADARFTRALARVELAGSNKKEALSLLEPSLAKLPDNPDELVNLANLLIETGGYEQAGAVIARLTAKGGGLPAEYLQARLLMRQEAWGEASKVLDSALARIPPTAALGKYVNKALVECYLHLDNPDKMLEACRRLVDRDPKSADARRTLADVLASQGKFDQALKEYRALPETPAVQLAQARVLLQHNLRLTESEQHWQEIDGLLNGLPQQEKQKFETKVLQANVLAAQKKLKEAEALMTAERDRDPKQPGPWLVLMQLATMEQRAPAVLTLLADAEKAAGPRVEWNVERVRYWSGVGDPEARKEFKKLESTIGDFTPGDGDQLRDALAQAHFFLGHGEDAERLWQEQAKRQPKDLGVRFRLLERYFQQGQAANLLALLEEIRRLDVGAGPLTTYGEAAYLVLQAKGGKQELLVDARIKLAKAAAMRPSWSRIPLLEAETYEIEKRKDRALERYKAAFDRGDRRLAVVRRMLQLLYEQRRFGEASALLRKIPDAAVSAAGLDRMAAKLLLVDTEDRHGESLQETREKALELARRAIKKDASDYRDYMWLGQVAQIANKTEEAEKAFRQACTLNDAIPDTWAALILFLASKHSAQAEIEMAKAQAKLPGAKAAQALAPGYEALGKLDLAEKQYKVALASNPNDPTGLRNLAGFLLRSSQTAVAEEVLDKILKPQTNAPKDIVVWARRTLALSLAGRGGLQSFNKAQKLLAENDRDQQDGAVDRFAKALVLATQPDHRREAIRVCENIAATDFSVLPQGQFLLAQLLEADGNWPQARKQLAVLVFAHPENQAYVAHYARGLLRYKEVQEAEAVVARLDEAAPWAWTTVELKARVLREQAQTDKAVEHVRAYAKKKDARLDLAAGLLDEFGQATQAEKLLRELVVTSKRPEASLLLALNLAKQKRTEEAITLCEAAWKTCPPETAAYASVGVLRFGNGNPSQQKLVEDWLFKAITSNPKSLYLKLLLADYYDGRGRHADAMSLQRSVLKQDHENVVALNNLACLLALQKQNLSEAKDLIDKAIDIAGKQATLLDSRAMVYLQKGQPQPAIDDLQQAIAQKQSASYYFHLAQAHKQTGNTAGFVESMHKAKALGLRAEDLHILERQAFLSLAKEAG